MTYYNTNGVSLEKGIQSPVDLYMVNSGSVNLSNVNIEILDNSNIDFENNYFTFSEINENSEFTLYICFSVYSSDKCFVIGYVLLK